MNITDKKTDLSRRDFIKRAVAAGIGSALIPLSTLSPIRGSAQAETAEQMTVPTRPFGKTGTNVSILSLCGVLKVSDQLVFRQAFKMGVTYWDTADCYGRGKSETGRRGIQTINEEEECKENNGNRDSSTTSNCRSYKKEETRTRRIIVVSVEVNRNHECPIYLQFV